MLGSTTNKIDMASILIQSSGFKLIYIIVFFGSHNHLELNSQDFKWIMHSYIYFLFFYFLVTSGSRATFKDLANRLPNCPTGRCNSCFLGLMLDLQFQKFICQSSWDAAWDKWRGQTHVNLQENGVNLNVDSLILMANIPFQLLKY